MAFIPPSPSPPTLGAVYLSPQNYTSARISRVAMARYEEPPIKHWNCQLTLFHPTFFSAFFFFFVLSVRLAAAGRNFVSFAKIMIVCAGMAWSISIVTSAGMWITAVDRIIEEWSWNSRLSEGDPRNKKLRVRVAEFDTGIFEIIGG